METDQSTKQSPATDSPDVAGCPAPICYGSWKHDFPSVEDLGDEDDPIFGSDDVLISISGKRVAVGAFFRDKRGGRWLEWCHDDYAPIEAGEFVDGWMPLPAPCCHNTQAHGARDEK